MSTNNSEKKTDSQENFVPLQQETNKEKVYGTGLYRRAEAVAPEQGDGQRYDRLGLRAVAERGRPSLGNRWDTLVYEEGLWSDDAGDQQRSQKPSFREEFARIIDVAKQVGDYIPSTVWETFGERVKIPTAESVVFTDEKNGRVVKFKDPYVIGFKEDSHLEILYNHHIHNRFFGNASYRFLGVSQDPDTGGVRFVLEQPFINSKESPTDEEIKKWFEERGFHQTDDKFFYTDGYVSFFDVLSNDNCVKDSNGNLCFIDPMIKCDRPVKEVIDHYLEMDKVVDAKLDRAGIEVGSRFKVYSLNSLNDFEIKRIDYGGGKLVFGPWEHNNHPDYQGEFEWPIDRVLENIKLSGGSRWIQVDENRNEIVIPAAKQALIERAKDSSSHAALTDNQVKALDRYCTLFSDKTPKEDILSSLIDNMGKDFKEAHVPDGWVKDLRDEVIDLAHGERREVSEGLKR